MSERRTRLTTRRERGLALLVVLLIGSILAAMTGALAYAVSARRMASGARVAAQQNSQAMRSALDLLSVRWHQGRLKQKVADTGQAHGSFTLGEHRVAYRLWDESAKQPVLSDSEARTPSLSGDEQDLILRPSAQKAEGPVPFLFEDVFEVPIDQLGDFYGSVEPSKDTAAIDRLTLWSNGRINIHTADRETIRRVFSELGPKVAESVAALKRYSHADDIDRLTSRLGLKPRIQKLVRLRLTTQPATLTARLACEGPSLRSEAFAVIDVQSNELQVRLWRRLPTAVNTANPQGGQGDG